MLMRNLCAKYGMTYLLLHSFTRSKTTKQEPDIAKAVDIWQIVGDVVPELSP
jgi:hypothetical protein